MALEGKVFRYGGVASSGNFLTLPYRNLSTYGGSIQEVMLLSCFAFFPKC